MEIRKNKQINSIDSKKLNQNVFKTLEGIFLHIINLNDKIRSNNAAWTKQWFIFFIIALDQNSTLLTLWSLSLVLSPTDSNAFIYRKPWLLTSQGLDSFKKLSSQKIYKLYSPALEVTPILQCPKSVISHYDFILEGNRTITLCLKIHWTFYGCSFSELLKMLDKNKIKTVKCLFSFFPAMYVGHIFFSFFF